MTTERQQEDGGPGGTAGEDGRIGTREAARRLGVKPETLYAYVSRGLLSSRRAPGGRGSTFDPAQVAALARRGRPSPPEPAPGAAQEPPGGRTPAGSASAPASP